MTAAAASARIADFSARYMVSTTVADEKQVRKDHHVKAFKNPSEVAVALTLAAAKKATTSWDKLIILGILSGRKLPLLFASQVSLHCHGRNCGFGGRRGNSTCCH